jgi:hypothetical protein
MGTDAWLVLKTGMYLLLCNPMKPNLGPTSFP